MKVTRNKRSNRKTWIQRVLLALCICSAPIVAVAKQPVCERYMAASAKKYEIPLGILYAVALTETGRRNSLHPYALNIGGKPYYPDSSRAAWRLFQKARDQGETMIDLGCMQINFRYHAKNFKQITNMLNPQKNVDYAARFLKKLFIREKSWTLAAARYHAGANNIPAQKRYVCAIITNLVASGFGQWTDNARKFCK